MKKVTVSCPSCGAVVPFRVSSSLVSVCPSCSSVVARNDRRVQDHGRVAAIVPTTSSFFIGQRGRWRKHPFEIIGRVQYEHPAGGRWEEWYAAFPGGRWCWIAEAQGKRYVTEKRELNSHFEIPEWDQLQPGQNLLLGADSEYTVNEVNTARLSAAEGEIPFQFEPNSLYHFADLSGDDRRFATLSWHDNEVSLYRGREVTLADLGIRLSETNEQPEVRVGGKTVNCPECGGMLQLRAPDRSLSVTCPWCSSLLSVNDGHLAFLSTLTMKVKPLIEPGRTGVLNGVSYTVIGFMRRAVRFDREYTWDEYLLYEPQTGFRWLVHSDLHWSFVEPVAEKVEASGRGIMLNGQFFDLFQRAWASVKYVLGEFYWKVEVGETVLTEDYIAPPRMISVESTPAVPISAVRQGAEGWSEIRYSERIVSQGTYISHDEVERAFQLERLPRGAAIAPNQPPPDFSSTYRTWPVLAIILCGADILMSKMASRPGSHGWTVLAIIMLSLYPWALWLYSRSFEASRWADSEFNPFDQS